MNAFDPIQSSVVCNTKNYSELDFDIFNKLRKIKELAERINTEARNCDDLEKLRDSKNELCAQNKFLIQLIDRHLSIPASHVAAEVQNGQAASIPLGKRLRNSQKDPQFAEANYQFHSKKRCLESQGIRHAQKLLKCLYEQKQMNGDVSIIFREEREVFGEKIPVESIVRVHKSVLKNSSEYFEELFCKGMLQKTEMGLYEFKVQFENLSKEIFEDIIQFIYLHEIEFQNPFQAVDYLKFASFFQIEDLKSLCMDYLSYNFSLITPDDLFELFEYANKKKCEIISIHLLKIICFNAHHVLLNASKQQLNKLSPESFENIIDQDFLSLDENKIAEVVYRWLEVKSIAASELFPKLINQITQKVRLSLIQRDKLYEVWQTKKIGNFSLFSDKNIIQAAKQDSSEKNPRVNAYESFKRGDQICRIRGLELVIKNHHFNFILEEGHLFLSFKPCPQPKEWIIIIRFSDQSLPVFIPFTANSQKGFRLLLRKVEMPNCNMDIEILADPIMLV